MNSYAFKRSYKREKVTATKSRNASMNGVRKMPPGKKHLVKMPPRRLPPGKLPTGNKPPKKIAPGKMPPRKSAHRKIAPRKIVSLDFCCF